MTALANVITGWTYAGRLGQLGAPGSFVFNANAHQPGAQRVMGKIYSASDVTQGEAVLTDLARHPSTAKFIATKFVRHFVADDPPPALVARLAEVFAKTDGDLKALALALVDSDDAWKAPLAKMRSPYEFLVLGRLLAQIPNDPGRYLGALNTLGQPLWSPAGPNGFADSNAAWGRRKASSCGSTSPRRSPRGSPTASIRATCSNSWPPTRPRSKRAKPSNARNCGSRRWHCC